jgi:hypothetical protein
VLGLLVSRLIDIVLIRSEEVVVVDDSPAGWVGGWTRSSEAARPTRPSRSHRSLVTGILDGFMMRMRVPCTSAHCG